MEYAQIAHCIGGQMAAASQPVLPPEVPAVKIPTAGSAAQQPETAAPAAVQRGDIPEKVFALMQTSNVTEAEVRRVFAGKGYYPEDTPWSVLEAEGFVDGWMIPQWDNIVDMAQQDRALPF